MSIPYAKGAHGYWGRKCSFVTHLSVGKMLGNQLKSELLSNSPGPGSQGKFHSAENSTADNNLALNSVQKQVR